MAPQYRPSSCGNPRPGNFTSAAGKKKTTTYLSAVASTPTKKIAHPEPAKPIVKSLHATKQRAPSSKMALPSSTQPSTARPPRPRQPSTTTKNLVAACGGKKPDSEFTAPRGTTKLVHPERRLVRHPSTASKKPDSGLITAPRDAKAVHPERRLAPGTAVCVRTRVSMISDKCWLVVWLPARVVFVRDAYHCTAKYPADLSPAFAGKMVRAPIDHVRVVNFKAQPPRNMATALEKKDR